MFRLSTGSDCQHRLRGLGALARHANAEQKSGAKLSESGHLASSLWTAVSPTTRGWFFYQLKYGEPTNLQRWGGLMASGPDLPPRLRRERWTPRKPGSSI